MTVKQCISTLDTPSAYPFLYLQLSKMFYYLLRQGIVLCAIKAIWAHCKSLINHNSVFVHNVKTLRSPLYINLFQGSHGCLEPFEFITPHTQQGNKMSCGPRSSL